MAAWHPIFIGNGGVISRFSIATDGTRVCATDTMGGYLWTGSQWQQLFLSTAFSSFSSLTDTLQNIGVDELVIDPSNSNNLWLLCNGILYKSTNKGTTFTAVTGFTQWPTNFPPQANFSPQKAWGPFIAVDPNNSNVVYVSTPANGLYVTADGGVTFTQVTTVGAGLPINVNSTAGSPSIGTNGTDSITIGTGTKNFNHNSGSFGFSVSTSEFVQVWQTSNPANQMLGTVSASSGTTFSLNVLYTQGSGTITDWTVSYMIDSNPIIAGARSQSGGHRVVFDTSGGTTGGKTANIFGHTYNLGTWKSTNAGSSWTAVSATGRPNSIRQMKCDAVGDLYVVSDDYTFPAPTSLKYSGTTWTALAPGGGAIWFDAVAVDPTQAGHVVFIEGSGFTLFDMTTDGGTTWFESGNPHTSYTSSSDVEWLTSYYTANPTAFFGITNAYFDPLNSGRCYFGSEGLWYSQIPTSGSSPPTVNSITLTQQTKGIEEFIGIKAVSANSGAAVFTCWDFPGFYKTVANATSYPSTITLPPANSQTQLERCYSVDWLWSNPLKMVAIIQNGTGNGNAAAQNFSGISTDGGQTWTAFSTLLTDNANTAGGDIAISDTNTFVWMQAQSAVVPKITTDGGATWNAISVGGGTPTSTWGPNNSYDTNHKSMDSDKANGDIYIYNVSINGAGDGFYKYTKATGLWSHQAVSLGVGPNANINQILKSVGVAGHLFFSGGLGAPPHPQNRLWYYTTDGWATNSSVSGFKEVQAFGYGATFAGASYPTLFAAGWFTGNAVISSVLTSVVDRYGIYYCKDFNSTTGAGTWIQCGDNPYPMGVLSNVTDLDGDKAIAGRVYVMTNGGAFYADVDAATPSVDHHPSRHRHIASYSHQQNWNFIR